MVSGQFQTVNGLPRANLARLNADGSVDPSFAPLALATNQSTAPIYLGRQSDGRLIVASSTWAADGSPPPMLLRLNLDLWHFAPGTYTLEVSQDLKNFTTYELFSVETVQSPRTLPWLIGSEPPGDAVAQFYRVVVAP